MLVREREVLVSAVSIVTIDKQTKPPACMALSASRQVSRLRRFLEVCRRTLRIILGIGVGLELADWRTTARSAVTDDHERTLAARTRPASACWLRRRLWSPPAGLVLALGCVGRQVPPGYARG